MAVLSAQRHLLLSPRTAWATRADAAAQDEPAPAYESHAVAEHADNQDAEAVAAEPVAEHSAEHTEAGEAETAE